MNVHSEFSNEAWNDSMELGVEPLPVISLRLDYEPDRADSISSVRLSLKVRQRVEKGQIEIVDPMPEILLEPDQRAALDEVIDWVIHPDPNDRVLTIGGYAGSGKSTTIRYIQAFLDALGMPSAITSLMNMSVEVLRKKGVSSARTMHSLLYHVDEHARKHEKVLRFIKNQHIAERIVVIDEGQVIPPRALQDFLSFPHVRVILVGDHAQLRPIGGDGPAPMDSPRIQLTTIRRQALGSNVIKVAHGFRQGLRPGYGKAEDVEIAPRDRFFREVVNPEIDQVIVGFNRTRHEVNRLIRRDRGFPDDIPAVGDKVICLNNRDDLGLRNGQMFNVARVEPANDDLVTLDLADQSAGELLCGIVCLLCQFGRNKLDYGVASQYSRAHGEINFFDYGYAISCHKAIGSQWDRGVIYEEVHPDWGLRRWSYTAVTRFVQSFVYYR